MDLPLRTDTSPCTAEPAKTEALPGVFFTAESEGAALGHLAGDCLSDRAKGLSSKSKRWTALGVATLGCAGLAVYGIATRFSSPDRSGITVRVPPAAQSVAAVKELPPPNLLKPLSPDQAAKENAERPFVPRPDTPASRFVLHADADNRTRALTCLAQAAYYEAAGEGTDGERAVAQVVLNRVRHPGFPSTICGVVYEGADRPTGCQFSFTCDGSMQRIPVPALWTRSRQIADQALKGKVFAPVGHATHYHADYVLPFWADSLDKSVQIGRHIFYRLRNSFGDAGAFSQRYRGTEPPLREPGTTVLIPPTPEGQKLASALISDGGETPPKAPYSPSHKPDTPLVIDSTTSALLADGQAPPQQLHRTKQSNDCSPKADRRQLVPLGATDMRADGDDSGC